MDQEYFQPMNNNGNNQGPTNTGYLEVEHDTVEFYNPQP